MSRLQGQTALKLVNKQFNAFTQLHKKTTAKPKTDGILSGKTVSIKDNISMMDEETSTTCASLTLRDYKSPFDATIVSLIERNGAIIEGKTNMDEFGMGNTTTNTIFGPTINPHSVDTPLTSGGSSGGAAASVSNNSVDFAIGTDTGGSIRLPAAYNKILGFKPSYSRISRWGVIPYAQSLDTVGILTKTEDIDLLYKVYEVLNVYDAKDPTSMDDIVRKEIDMEEAKIQLDFKDSGRPIRIGIPLEFQFKGLDQSIRDKWQDLLLDLKSNSNCEIIPIGIPSLKHSLSAYYTLSSSEMSSNLSRFDGIRYGYRTPDLSSSSEPEYMINRSLGFGKEVQSRILLGTYALSSYGFNNNFLKAQRIRSNLINEFNDVFKYTNPLTRDTKGGEEEDDNRGKVDFIVCPTSVSSNPPDLRLNGEANKISSVESYLADLLTVPSSLAGLPTLSFPYGKDGFGFQIMTQFGYDSTLLNTSKQILQAIR